ncbi:MAG: hypothetical protein M1817_005020 [Caeruleum heppii]|nr:MAG: hypothetical protein M1817_005020 [Caeruleum heppii]
MASVPKKVPIPRRGVDYRGKVVLAPMVRSGELPTRLLSLQYGADLVWGPETVDRSLIGCTPRHNSKLQIVELTRPPSVHAHEPIPITPREDSTIFRFHLALESDKFIFQIGTSSPTLAVQAAHLVAPYCAGIDVNAGCPKSFSTAGGMGAALLRTPDLLCSILTSLVKEVGAAHEIGISVKIRLLKEPEETATLVRRLCATGITGLTVHCRTTPMRPRERAIRDQLRMIGEICRDAGVACLMNGDVTSRAEALSLAAEYGVDGGMIATAAETNPSVFRPEGKAPWREVATEFIKTALAVRNRWGNTKFLLSHFVPGKDKIYRLVSSAKGYVEICEILGLDEMLPLARQVDEEVGIVAKKMKFLEQQEMKRKKEVPVEPQVKRRKASAGETEMNGRVDGAMDSGLMGVAMSV